MPCSARTSPCPILDSGQGKTGWLEDFPGGIDGESQSFECMRAEQRIDLNRKRSHHVPSLRWGFALRRARKGLGRSASCQARISFRKVTSDWLRGRRRSLRTYLAASFTSVCPNGLNFSLTIRTVFFSLSLNRTTSLVATTDLSPFSSASEGGDGCAPPTRA